MAFLLDPAAFHKEEVGVPAHALGFDGIRVTVPTPGAQSRVGTRLVGKGRQRRRAGGATLCIKGGA